MSAYRLTHLDDTTLLHDLSALVARDRATTAQLLAHIAEVDDRRLFLAAACSSMFAYCVRELGLSEDATYKRIQAARAARRFPRLFADVAAGRLHLAAIVLLAPHLTTANEEELVAAAAGRSKAEIEAWLATRFAPAGGAAPLPRERLVPIRVKAAGAAVRAIPAGELPLAPVADRPAREPASEPADPAELTRSSATSQPAPGQVARASQTHVLMQVAITRATEAKLHRAQALLAHAVPSGQISEVLDRALDALLERLEKRKGASPAPPKPSKPSKLSKLSKLSKPSKPPKPTKSRLAAEPTAPIAGTARRRSIPAAVRRAVWARDAGRCTFEDPRARRCDTLRWLEFDHVVPFARGGETTAANLRLRCRAHNQLEADRVFGDEFMRRKRAVGGAAEGRRSPAGSRNRRAPLVQR